MEEQKDKKVDISTFSPEDWKRLTEYVSLLMTIEKQMRKKKTIAEDKDHE